MTLISPQLVTNAALAAKAVAAAVPMGGAAIAAGKAVLDLVNDIHEAATASPAVVKEFEEGREALERAVNEHADRTAALLD